MKNLIFRVDGGNVWGVSMGHVKRTLHLATELRQKYNITFLMQDYSDGVQYVQDNGWMVSTIPIGMDCSRYILDYCERINPDKIIFDLPEFNYPDFTKYARKNKIDLIVFDIKGLVKGDPSCIINDSFVSEFVQYDIVGKETKLFTGPEYFLLPRDYQVVKKPIIREEVKNVVISMGGSDPAGLTIKILSKLPLQASLHYHVIMGPAFQHYQDIAQLCIGISNVTLYKDPQNFIDILANADIAIIAAGRTLFECSYLGLPVIIIPSIDHESSTANEYSRMTGSVNLGIWKSEETPDKLDKTMELYLNNFDLRKKMSESAKKIIDGQGISRILDIIALH